MKLNVFQILTVLAIVSHSCVGLCMEVEKKLSSISDIPSGELKTQIYKAWKRRQKITESFQIIYKVQSSIVSDVGTENQKDSKNNSDEKSEVHSNQESLLKFSAKLFAFNKGKMRYERWDFDTQEKLDVSIPNLVPGVLSSSIEVFDGEKMLIHYPNSKSSSGDVFSKVHINDSNKIIRVADFQFLLSIYRGVDLAEQKIFPIDEATLKIIPSLNSETSPIVVLNFGNQELWLDSSRDYIPVKYLGFNHNRTKIFMEYDLNYKKQTDSTLWFPSKWTAKLMMPGSGVIQEDVVNIISSAANDDNLIPISLFSITYTEGSFIIDDREKSTYRFSILSNGHRIKVNPFLSYSDSLKLIDKSYGIPYLWILILIGINFVVVFCILVLVWGKRRRNSIPKK